MRNIVGVHGIRNFDRDRQPPAAAEALAAGWRAAIVRGLGTAEGWRLDMAYYAHRLRVETGQGDDDLASVDDELRKQLSDWAAALPLPAEVDHGEWLLPVRQAIDRLSRYSGLNRALIEPFVAVALREVRTYFRNRRARLAAREEVADAIDRTGATVVLAHSLGSVIAFETLLAEPDLQVDLLITMGSPLGLPRVVLDRLEPRGARTAPLPNVARWVNVADPGDIVAIPRPLGRVFPGIDRDEEVTIGAVAFHKVERYLESGVVAEEVAKVLPG